ncbi:hypothetical protein B0T21DRAFT_432530 [Apiosordaria backusii]|uniref:Uncharacterized protein n=1 Tax=Apiosordaria backusii TaxID=314023 RepID=A0AA39ZPS7_9PEZI|nr:hypothetical protein B0T21DRAFT_432530 [Apiosordaria backusii]
MAASIPAMRVLFNEVRTSARSKGRHYYQATTPQYGANRSGIVTTVKTEGNREEERPACGDDMSDRRILGSGSETGRDPKRICRVDEVEVVSTHSNGKRRELLSAHYPFCYVRITPIGVRVIYGP